MEKASTIDEVISILDSVIQDQLTHKSNLVLFPILYKKVTERIKQGIELGDFENNPRMERLDVLFANRYLEAYFLWKDEKQPTQSWVKAFEASKNSKLIILQHLLLGINAHINLDLGIAVSETMGAQSLEGVKNDYHTINDILASMVDEVQDRIGKVSPLFYLLDKIGKGKEDVVVSFSIEVAREEAWRFANQYHKAPHKASFITERDQSIARIGNKIAVTKSRFLRWILRFVKWFESKNIHKIARILSEA